MLGHQGEERDAREEQGVSQGICVHVPGSALAGSTAERRLSRTCEGMVHVHGAWTEIPRIQQIIYLLPSKAANMTHLASMLLYSLRFAPTPSALPWRTIGGGAGLGDFLGLACVGLCVAHPAGRQAVGSRVAGDLRQGSRRNVGVPLTESQCSVLVEVQAAAVLCIPGTPLPRNGQLRPHLWCTRLQSPLAGRSRWQRRMLGTALGSLRRHR